MTMTVEGMGFKCGYQYGLLCTLTGRKCFVDEDGGAQQCLRARWAKEFDIKHATGIDAAKSQESA